MAALDDIITQFRPKFQPRVTTAGAQLVEDQAVRAKLMSGRGTTAPAVAPPPVVAPPMVAAAPAPAPAPAPAGPQPGDLNTATMGGRTIAIAQPVYNSVAGVKTPDWTETPTYAAGVRRAEQDKIEAALLDIGEAGRTSSGASGERQRLATIARARLRLDPTGGAAARRAEAAAGLAAQTQGLAVQQAARLNQIQSQYLAATDPAEKARLGEVLMTLAGKAEEFKPVTVGAGEELAGPPGMLQPVKRPEQLVAVGSRGTIRPLPLVRTGSEGVPAVGAKVKQADGKYPIGGGKVATVKGGVITEIK